MRGLRACRVHRGRAGVVFQCQPTPSAPVSLSANSGPQAPGGTVPATIGITWDQASKDDALDVAENAMTDFARPTPG